MHVCYTRVTPTRKELEMTTTYTAQIEAVQKSRAEASAAWVAVGAAWAPLSAAHERVQLAEEAQGAAILALGISAVWLGTAEWDRVEADPAYRGASEEVRVARAAACEVYAACAAAGMAAEHVAACASAAANAAEVGLQDAMRIDADFRRYVFSLSR
jgi:hypothetical protein